MEYRQKESDLCSFTFISEIKGQLVAEFYRTNITNPVVVTEDYEEEFYIPVTELQQRMKDLREIGVDPTETDRAMRIMCNMYELHREGVFDRHPPAFTSPC